MFTLSLAIACSFPERRDRSYDSTTALESSLADARAAEKIRFAVRAALLSGPWTRTSDRWNSAGGTAGSPREPPSLWAVLDSNQRPLEQRRGTAGSRREPPSLWAVL